MCQTGTPFGRALGLDPLGLLASGALLAVVDPNDVPPALEALRSSGAGSQVIGRVAPAAGGRGSDDGNRGEHCAAAGLCA